MKTEKLDRQLLLLMALSLLPILSLAKVPRADWKLILVALLVFSGEIIAFIYLETGLRWIILGYIAIFALYLTSKAETKTLFHNLKIAKSANDLIVNSFFVAIMATVIIFIVYTNSVDPLLKLTFLALQLAVLVTIGLDVFARKPVAQVKP